MFEIALLRNGIRDYSWGSRTAVAELLGRPVPSDRPEAELWIGAHPSLPSAAMIGGEPRPLDGVIGDDPVAALGPAAARRFDNRLPFLLKYLAAAEPLSIQAHPNLDQAREGFDREEQEGIPIDAAHRNYRDRNHKPEITLAITPFWALTRFRRPEQIIRLTRRVESRELAALAAGLAGRGEAGLKLLFESLMTAPAERQAKIVRAVVLAARVAVGREDPDPVWQWILQLQEAYPDDVGVACPLLLNLVRLDPGEALFTGPGELHAYLDGVGIELMANSDNVLRGGTR